MKTGVALKTDIKRAIVVVKNGMFRRLIKARLAPTIQPMIRAEKAIWKLMNSPSANLVQNSSDNMFVI